MGSSDFIKAKKLIYYQMFDIAKVEIHGVGPANPDKSLKDNATIVFRKGEQEEVIQSEEADFFMLACHIKATFRDGQKKLIEVKDTNGYYSNVDLLIPKKDDYLKEVIRDIKTGKKKLPDNFQLYDALKNIINKKLKEENAKILLNNYFAVLGSQILLLEQVNGLYENVKKRIITNNVRFTSFMAKVDDIVKKHIINHPPLIALEKYLNNSKTDAEILIKSLVTLEKTSHERWKAMSNNGKQGIEGKIASKYMVDDYNDYFEVLQKILRDLAIFINEDTKDYEVIDNFYKIDNVLKRNGYSDLVSTIIVKLRHSGTHWDIDYLEKKGKVLIYDTRSKEKKLIDEISYQKLIEKNQCLRDLTWASFFSFFMWRELIFLRAIDSPDLKFFLVENVKD